ncbi:MAG: 50S ribosomal protein L29 [Patescibacteria group bacterium]|jgi:ribosomal protein L29|nr:50S ribosomal protein L29 [Patescibacteria group bacterium]
MEFKELNEKKESDLQKLLQENREKVRELRFKDSNKQLKNVRDIRNTKKDIARIQTVLNNKKK